MWRSGIKLCLHKHNSKSMEHISQRIQAMSPSATLAMSQKSAELKALGVDVINL